MDGAESDGAESDWENETAMLGLASLGCSEVLARSIQVDSPGGDSKGATFCLSGEDAVRARKVQNLTAMLLSVGCGEVLARILLPDAAEGESLGDTMTVLSALSQEKMAALFQAAAVEMAARVGEGVEAWKSGTNAEAEAGLRTGKFVDGKYGSLELFDTGLEGYVGLPDVRVFEAMKREHTSTDKFTPDKEEWEHVVTKGPDGKVFVNNTERRAGTKMCEDFMKHEMTKKAGLTIEEVIALRLYTGPQFQKYNQHLRGLGEARTAKATQGEGAPQKLGGTRKAKKRGMERQYTTTIHAIASALKKVARFTKLPEGGKVYRGMSGVRLPAEFRVPDEFGCRGGVELGFLSTSTSKEQALAYIEMSKCRPTLFEIQLGQVDRGATLRWISQFPSEDEVLLPPLSNLEVVGEPLMMQTKRGPVNVCQLRVNGLTIDELQARRKTLHLSMCDNLMSEVELTVMAKAGDAYARQEEAAD
ncbi:hypothetical protein T484DRAFT_1784654, partial [Baffinella frigidus]